MKCNKRKRSEYTYMEIMRSLLYYYWEFLWEDELVEKKYIRVYRIVNAKFYKNNFKRDE